MEIRSPEGNPKAEAPKSKAPQRRSFRISLRPPEIATILAAILLDSSVERRKLKTSNVTRVYAGTHAMNLQSQVHSARELRRQNSRPTLTSRWQRFLPFACWPPVCWSSPISSQAARTPHRMDQPRNTRNTRNTRNPETGLFAFRVFRVFRGYHLGCGFAALARLVLAMPGEDFGFPLGLRPSDFGFWLPRWGTGL